MSVWNRVGVALVLAAGLGLPVFGWALAGQDGAGKAKTAQGEGLASINADFDRELKALETKRLERLARLAASQPKDQAEATYEAYFQYALGSNLFREAEPVAERVLKAGDAAPRIVLLAEITNVLGEVERGAFDESLNSLGAVFDAARGARPAAGAHHVLPLPMRLSLLEAYYQRLVQGNAFDVARKAFRLAQERATEPAVREFAERRLARLDMIGKPAPAIEGDDVDGKPFRLADLKGDVVLVAFWATWCISNSEELAWFHEVYDAGRARGFRVLGINLDTLEGGGRPTAEVRPDVRRFLIDRNVPWPNLINGTDSRDFAKAYSVTEVPANVLIGRDGKVLHLDLTRSNLDKVVTEALGR
jgi:peroxiredoxin